MVSRRSFGLGVRLTKHAVAGLPVLLGSHAGMRAVPGKCNDEGRAGREVVARWKKSIGSVTKLSHAGMRAVPGKAYLPSGKSDYGCI